MTKVTLHPAWLIYGILYGYGHWIIATLLILGDVAQQAAMAGWKRRRG